MGINFLRPSDADSSDLSTRELRLMLGALLLTLTAVLLLGSWLMFRHSTRTANRIVCFGDSLTSCGGFGGRYSDFLAAELPLCEVINRGQNGDTLENGRVRFPRAVLDLNPSIVILELGANDFHKANRPLEALKTDLEYMIRALKERGVKIIIAGVFGPQLDSEGITVPKHYKEGSESFGRQILEMERALAEQYGCEHVENIQAPLNEKEDWADERHPDADGNRKVAALLLPVVTRLMKMEKED